MEELMNTFRDKYIKNKLYCKLAYYECIRGSEINISTEKEVKNWFLNAK